MSFVALMYHDVVRDAEWSASGFAGADADLYKLDAAHFQEHLEAIRKTAPPLPGGGPGGVAAGGEAEFFLTFDDGGASAHTTIAPLLEEFGWRGHFFVTGNRIDTPGFLSRTQIRDLHSRGHVIGAHSWSHPQRMSSCSRAELLGEWTRSAEVISSATGVPTSVGSVPGGYYSRAVAETAGDAGLRLLFTSEPTTRAQRVGETLVIGRYTVQRGTSARAAAGLAGGRGTHRPRQWLLWNVKKLLKRAGGVQYLKIRRALLAGAAPRDQTSIRETK